MKEFDLKEIERFLEAVHKMSLSQDWSESHAQELVMWGGELYEEYFLKNDN